MFATYSILFLKSFRKQFVIEVKKKTSISKTPLSKFRMVKPVNWRIMNWRPQKHFNYWSPRSIIPVRKMMILQKNTLKKRKFQLSTSCRFMRTEFNTPTSNIPERFFSKAGYAYNGYRKSMLPANLEMQLFLHYNHKFWDINTVKECVDKNNF